MTAAVKPWDRLLWGIVFTSKGIYPSDPPALIGGGWDTREGSDRPSSEPSRPVLFRTRKQAADWCRERNAMWKKNNRPLGWHVKPVRVREVVSVLS